MGQDMMVKCMDMMEMMMWMMMDCEILKQFVIFVKQGLLVGVYICWVFCMCRWLLLVKEFMV